MKISKTYAYVGAFRFPDRDAAAKRVLGIGQILKKIGHKVIFLGGEKGDESEKNFKGFSYYSQSELDHNSSSVFEKISNFLNSGSNTVKWLESHNKEIDSVIVYNSSNIFLSNIKKFCKRHNKELIVDCTEWYDSSHLPGGRFGLVSIDNYLKMNFGYKKNIDKMIVISSFLKNFYSPNIETIFIPPLNSYPDFTPSRQYGNKINIIYAGSPAQKDNLISVIKAIGHSAIKEKIDFYIIGIDSFSFSYGNLPSNVFFKGRLSHEDVLKEYLKADFSVLIRPNKRYAHAGFSTKFVESNYFEVPVITTNTSDLAKYVINNKNGFIIDSDKPLEDELEKILIQIVNMDRSSITKIKEMSKALSREFNLENYVEEMEAFLSH